jgi:ATP phosphoribosyltransferase
MADLEDVAERHEARTGRRLRVATKYVRQTRAFFAAHGVSRYRIVESAGATEGAPASGAADLVVDITTTGATLAGNGLKPLRDGLILASEAQLAASLRAGWSGAARAALRALLDATEARSAARALTALRFSPGFAAEALEEGLRGALEIVRPGEALAARDQAQALARAIAAAGGGPVTSFAPGFVFRARNDPWERFCARLDARGGPPEASIA